MSEKCGKMVGKAHIQVSKKSELVNGELDAEFQWSRKKVLRHLRYSSQPVV